MRRIHARLTVILFLPLIAAYADDQINNEDHEARRCINTGAIIRVRVINHGNIVFTMRGNKMYLNSLRWPCPSLARQGAFYYATQTRSLCEFEISPTGTTIFGKPAGGRCALGMFRPTSKENLALQFAPRLVRRDTDVIDAASIEEIGTERENDKNENSE